MNYERIARIILWPVFVLFAMSLFPALITWDVWGWSWPKFFEVFIDLWVWFIAVLLAVALFCAIILWLVGEINFTKGRDWNE